MDSEITRTEICPRAGPTIDGQRSTANERDASRVRKILDRIYI